MGAPSAPAAGVCLTSNVGILFPHSEEYPNHEPVASPLDELTLPRLVNAGVVSLVVAMAVQELCPNYESTEDPPHEDQAPIALPINPLSAMGSTSAAVPFFGNIDSTAAQVVWQRRMLSVTQTMPSTNVALLSSTGGAA